jgi:hypothetical protein
MKYIKKFNEELSPSIYKNAGAKLTDKGHTQRGKALSDYGDSKLPKENDVFTFFIDTYSYQKVNPSTGTRLITPNKKHETYSVKAKWDFTKKRFLWDGSGENESIRIGAGSDGLFYEKGYNKFDFDVYLPNRKEAKRLYDFVKENNINLVNRYHRRAAKEIKGLNINDLYKDGLDGQKYPDIRTFSDVDLESSFMDDPKKSRWQKFKDVFGEKNKDNNYK